MILSSWAAAMNTVPKKQSNPMNNVVIDEVMDLYVMFMFCLPIEPLPDSGKSAWFFCREQPKLVKIALSANGFLYHPVTSLWQLRCGIKKEVSKSTFSALSSCFKQLFSPKCQASFFDIDKSLLYPYRFRYFYPPNQVSMSASLPSLFGSFYIKMERRKVDERRGIFVCLFCLNLS